MPPTHERYRKIVAGCISSLYRTGRKRSGRPERVMQIEVTTVIPA